MQIISEAKVEKIAIEGHVQMRDKASGTRACIAYDHVKERHQ